MEQAFQERCAPRCVPRRTKATRYAACAFVRLVLLVCSAIPLLAQTPAVDEYPVKAAFLFNFAKFVEWPQDAFKAPDEAVTICVLGTNPFGGALEETVRGKLIGAHPFSIREVTNAQQASKCHIVFVTASERKRCRSFLDELKGRSILTVGEAEDFTANGGIINFKLKDARVRIEIDAAAAERARLRISSKLLSLAEITRK